MSERITAAALRARAIDHHKAQRHDQAMTDYRLYLANRPQDAGMWSNYGVLLRTLKDYEAAIAAHRRALELSPDEPAFLANCANALFDADEGEEALSLRLKVLELEPGKASSHHSVAISLRNQGHHRDAIDRADAGLAIDPDHHDLKIQRAMSRLSLGDYPRGFAEFEARWDGDEISRPNLKVPQWQGEDLTGKTVLVMPEQGFGDTILMSRFLPGLKALGPRVRLFTKPPLMRLFQGLEGVDALAAEGEAVGDIDHWIPMMDLPRYLGTTFDSVPPPPALAIPEDSHARAAKMLAPYAERYKVGVLWSGSLTYRANHKRSFSHRRFLDLNGLPGLQMVSLYKGDLAADFRKDPVSALILDACSSDRDFADTAALIERLDLVVTMDSACAHLAASLGKETWNLLHSSAYWLYEPARDSTPWYPAMRLIRQDTPGDWAGVFARVRALLSDRLEPR